MSAGKLTWGRRDWLGLMVLFLSSITADVIGALLAVKGILPMGSVAAWVYGGWALGAFLGVRVAVRGRSGTVQASLLLAAGAYVLIWLVGLTVFGTAAFAHHGLGITLAVVAGALLGAVLGQLAARSVPEASRTELAAYLRQYAAVWGETTDRTASLLRVAGVYLRYPLLVTVLGFCGAAGAALILPVLAAEGFFLSFSAGCFAAALGRSGVLLALAAFGVRCLIVLPCSIYPAMLVGERNRWRKLAVCGALLLLGMALELTLVPRLVQWALGTLS